MTTYFALLRGINVSGQKLIRMADLRLMFEGLGVLKVRTYIQSGNVLFESPEDAKVLRGRIERQIEATFGFEVTVVLRTLAELEQILAACPFPMEEVEAGPVKTYIALLAETPEPAGIDRLLAASGGADEFRISGDQVYILCKEGMGKSKFTNNMLEQKLGVAATTRNWKTMKTLVGIGQASE